jgi:hypothetical protein
MTRRHCGNVANEITMSGAKAKKGERMTKGRGWRLAATKRKRRIFVGTLLETTNVNGGRLAIFSVPK